MTESLLNHVTKSFILKIDILLLNFAVRPFIYSLTNIILQETRPIC